MNEYEVDVVVIGGGVLGLETAMQFGKQGYKTIVLEKSKTLADGPSVRNQRFLHAGTYHGAQDSPEAVTVARQTRAGFKKIQEFIPEAIDSQPAYALFVDTKDSNRALLQWQEAGVAVSPVSLETFGISHPEVTMSDLVAVFETNDRVVDMRRYMQKLVETSLVCGVEFILGALVKPDGESRVSVVTNDQTFGIKAKKIIVTAGYGLGSFYEQVTGEVLPVTYYKSHLFALSTPPTKSNLLAVGRDTIMSATFDDGTGVLRSVIGVNYSDYQVEKPDFSPDSQKIAESFAHIKAVLPNISSNFMAYACIKPNIAIGKTAGVYSLSARVFSHPSHLSYIFAVPGKMTEAPIAAEAILAKAIGILPQDSAKNDVVREREKTPKVTEYPYSDFSQVTKFSL